MFSFIKNSFFTSPNQKTLNTYNKLLENVNLHEEVKKLSDNDLKENTKKFKEMLKKGETLDFTSKSVSLTLEKQALGLKTKTL